MKRKRMALFALALCIIGSALLTFNSTPQFCYEITLLNCAGESVSFQSAIKPEAAS